MQKSDTEMAYRTGGFPDCAENLSDVDYKTALMIWYQIVYISFDTDKTDICTIIFVILNCSFSFEVTIDPVVLLFLSLSAWD